MATHFNHLTGKYIKGNPHLARTTVGKTTSMIGKTKTVKLKTLTGRGQTGEGGDGDGGGGGGE